MSNEDEFADISNGQQLIPALQSTEELHCDFSDNNDLTERRVHSSSTTVL